MDSSSAGGRSRSGSNGLQGRRESASSAADGSDRVDKRVRRVIESMNRGRLRPMDLANLAAEVRLSRSRLRHLFKRHMGETIAAYDKQRRLDLAAERLEMTFLSVKEILAEAGYQSASHFTRDFKRRFGMTPTEWRACRPEVGPGLPSSSDAPPAVRES